MIAYPHFDPVAFHIGPLPVHWYGIMYLVAFVIFFILARYRTSQAPFAQEGWKPNDIEDLLFYGVLGVVLGGRLGYVLFYQPGYYFFHPINIFKVWDGGMSFHGGLIGVGIAMLLFSRFKKYHFFQVSDLVAPCVPLGLGFGRLGNFINGELWGRPASPALPWAMIFPTGGNIPRHPSQLYEFLLEGVLLFVIMWIYGRKARHEGRVAAAFLIGYGILRFVAEHWREPDAFLGFLSLGLTMGQWLCIPMVLVGVVLWFWCGGRANKAIRQ